MKPKLLLVAVVVACVWTGGVRMDACGCGGSRLPCEAAWEATAVFVGELVSIVDEKPEPRRDPMSWPSDPSRRFTFRVTEPFRGVSGPQIHVYGERSSSCAMTLTTGERYLVYAFRLGEGSLYTHYCSRTRPVAHAADDLEYLRGPARQASGLGTIHGVARQPDLQPKEYYNGHSLYRFGAADERAVWLTQDGMANRPRIELAAEQRVWAGELHLPKAVQLTTLTGSVSDAAGRVPRNARVRVLADPGVGDADGGVTPVDATGGFTFTLIAGRTYQLIAERNFEPGTARVQARSDPFKAVAGALSLSLRFEK